MSLKNDYYGGGTIEKHTEKEIAAMKKKIADRYRKAKEMLEKKKKKSK